LVAAGAKLKLLAEDSGNSLSVQVELRVCIREPGSRRGGWREAGREGFVMQNS
jgi:hypothetical protein